MNTSNPVALCIEAAKSELAGTSSKTKQHEVLSHLIARMEKIERDAYGPLRRPYKFEMLRTKDGQQFYGRLVSPNGKIIHMTETMHRRRGVENNFRTAQIGYTTAVFKDLTR